MEKKKAKNMKSFIVPLNPLFKMQYIKVENIKFYKKNYKSNAKKTRRYDKNETYDVKFVFKDNISTS